MTKLQAVNRILRAISEPPATALDTGGTSVESEAEQILDEQIITILERGWKCNTLFSKELNFASVSLTGTIAAGTFTKGEIVTQTTSGAKGYIASAYTVGGLTFLICPLVDSEDFDGTHDITGAASTATITAVAAATSGKITSPYGTLRIEGPSTEAGEPSTGEPLDAYEMRDGYLYNITDDVNDEWDDSIKLKLIQDIDFTYLHNWLQTYIVASASVDFGRLFKRDNFDEQLHLDALAKARAIAYREETKASDTNILKTSEHRSLTGNRQRFYGQ